jgi:ribosomal protein S19E (S16A)
MGDSELFASGRVSKVTRKGMEAIETKVLDRLEEAGWIKIKREHFIISKDKEHEFVDNVKRLYDYFTINRPSLTES